MPVRIIFRGLVLFRIENEGTQDGRIVAQLIDDKSMSGSMSAHAHQAEMQVLTGKMGQSLVPVPLERGVAIELTADGEEYVKAAPSYRQYVPKLSTIAGGRFSLSNPRNDNFIRNRIIVNRGTIRAKELVTWDAGGYPLDGSPGTGANVVAPVNVRFMFSGWARAVASECIIDIEEESGLSISGDRVTAEVADHDDQHVPPDTVEILITNLPPQRRKPVPWSVHYQWLFKAAGYEPASFDQSELAEFMGSAWAYAKNRANANPENQRAKILEFLGADLPFLSDGTALPFPYLSMPRSLADESEALDALAAPAADPWNRPLCPQGDE